MAYTETGFGIGMMIGKPETTREFVAIDTFILRTWNRSAALQMERIHSSIFGGRTRNAHKFGSLAVTPAQG